MGHSTLPSTHQPSVTHLPPTHHPPIATIHPDPNHPEKAPWVEGIIDPADQEAVLAELVLEGVHDEQSLAGHLRSGSDGERVAGW